MSGSSRQFSDRVLRAMARWPDVPSVYRWLSLDRRGRWLMKGTPVTHPLLIDFINQHYVGAADGRYYFQNGPQKVFVDLEGAPFILSLLPGQPFPLLRTHTGHEVHRVSAAYLLDDGGFALMTELGPAEIDDRDLIHLEELLSERQGGDPMGALESLASGHQPGALLVSFGPQPVSVEFLSREALGASLGFVTDPKPTQDEVEYCD